MAEQWSGFSYIVTNLARFIRPDEITFSGVNSTLPMLACLMAKRAYDWDFVYINVAGGVNPKPSRIPLSSSDPVLAEHTASIFSNEDFYDLCTRGRMDLTFLGAAQIDGEGCANNSCIGNWHEPRRDLPRLRGSAGAGAAQMMRPGPPSATTPLPDASQARIPPSMLKTSNPCCVSHATARAERLPLRHVIATGASSVSGSSPRRYGSSPSGMRIAPGA